MLQLNLQPLLTKKNKSKYWLYEQLNNFSPISYTNFNAMFCNRTKSIRYSMLANLCTILECNIDDLFKNE